MLNFNKQLILATLTLTSLFSGLANVQAIIQASKRIISDVDSKDLKDTYSSLAAEFATISLLDDQLDEKKSLAESDEVKVTAHDKSSLPIPLNLFSLSEVIQTGKNTQEKTEEEQTISLVNGLLEKVKFQNIRELMLFKKALSLIKDGNKTNMFPRLTIQQLSHAFSECLVTKEQALNLFFLSEYLQIGQLSSALAYFLAKKCFIAGLSLKEIIEKTSESIAHRIMRERLYATGHDTTDFSNFLEDDGFLPTKMQLPATFYLPEDSHIMNLRKKIEYLWDHFKDRPECNQLIQQLPPSHLKAFLIEKIIYTNIDRPDRPDFDMITWYLQLPRGRGLYSLRERVLTTLRQKAAEMITGKSDGEILGLLAHLPEGWFTMELRRIYHERHHGRLIDAVAINDIMERINAPGNTVYMSYMDLAMPLKSIIELAIIRNEIHPITHLWLSNNQLTGQIPENICTLANLKELSLKFNPLTEQIPASIGKLRYLTYLNLENNQLTGQIPASIDKLRYLTYLNLENNQLTGPIPESIRALGNLTLLFLNNNRLDTTSEASRQLVNQLQTRAKNPVYVST